MYGFLDCREFGCTRNPIVQEIYDSLHTKANVGLAHLVISLYRIPILLLPLPIRGLWNFFFFGSLTESHNHVVTHLIIIGFASLTIIDLLSKQIAKKYK